MGGTHHIFPDGDRADEMSKLVLREATAGWYGTASDRRFCGAFFEIVRTH